MRFANVGNRPAVLDGDGYVDLSPLVPAHRLGDERFIWVVERWAEVCEALADGRGPARRHLDAGDLGPPIPRPPKVIGAPVNYRDHQREMDAANTIDGLGVFLKAPTSVIGPGDAILIPYADRRTDQEAELGVVIGRGGRDIAAVDALDHVFGYTCLVDATVRGGEDRSTRKSFDTFTPIGPWIVTPDELDDPNCLRLRGWVNDELRQDVTTDAMVYAISDIIEYASSVMTLEPGDVIATGTPAGVGPLTPGDTVTIEIEGVGRLEVDVAFRSPAGIG